MGGDLEPLTAAVAEGLLDGAPLVPLEEHDDANRDDYGGHGAAFFLEYQARWQQR